MLDRVIVRYDLERHPFPQMVRDHVGYDLARLHEQYEFDRLVRGTEQHTVLHKLLYSIGPEFGDMYRAFVADVVQPTIGGEIFYQRIPNFRFQLPNNVAVRGMHRDRDDGHQPAEINCWMPLTPVCESSSVWIERADGAGDHRPALAQPGEMLIFDGPNLEHGNVLHTGDSTRVSFDFRVVRQHAFVKSDKRSMYEQVRYAIGEYFDPL
ncbi:MAG: hypothetical protein ACT4OX_13135 [Actinomycetota bacterium]